VTRGSVAQLSRGLRSWLWTPANLALIGGHGWNDGGCRILAEALICWLGLPEAAFAGVRDAAGVQHHVAVRVGSKLIDGDGISDEATLLRRWRTREMVASAGLTPY
jgi:hypothetical protein